MRRTNIYLDDGQLERLRFLADRQGKPVASVVRDAIDAFLDAYGVEIVSEDEWQRRFDALLARRRRTASGLDLEEERVRRDVGRAVREARKARAADRR